MIKPPILANENARLSELKKYNLLDTLPENEYDNLVNIASTICETPIALVSLVDKDRQWFKSKVGLEPSETPREISFCGHAIANVDHLLEVQNTDEDERFFDNPLTQEDLKIKFYAGMPIKRNGMGIGTICVVDQRPRSLTTNQKNALKFIANQISFLLDQRLINLETVKKRDELQVIFENVDDLLFEINEEGNFLNVNETLSKLLGVQKKELIGTNFTQYIKKNKTKTLNKFLDQITKRILSRSYKFNYLSSDNAESKIELTIKLIIDNQQKIVSIVCLGRNVTEIYQKNKDLKRLSTAVKITTNAVLILDKSFNIEWVNESFTKVFGYSLSEIQGKNPGSFLNGPKTNPNTLAEIEKKLSRRESICADLINYHKDGSLKWIQTVMNPVLDENGDLLNYVCIEHDITEQKREQTLIKNQYQDIYSSLNYATRIQNALIPSENKITSINKNCFAIYYPKEVVSGDFFIVDRIPTEDGHYADVYAVADCTGHGVPGAMLSVLCYTILKETMQKPEIDTPGKALNYAKDRLQVFLNPNNSSAVYDGMDVSICIVLPHKKLIQFSSANLPLYRIREDTLTVFKGNRQGVGFNMQTKKFSDEVFPYQSGDQFYLFSDGIVDQFGGDRNKKFMSKRLRSTLLKNSNLEISEQKKLLNNEFLNWKADYEQTDDICILGFKLD